MQNYEVGAIARVSPAVLIIERNVRNAQPDAGLIASIKDVGVLEPITAVLNSEGALVVRFGHRRTLAAVAAGLDEVPVFVSGQQGDDVADEIHRVITQFDENTHRSGLTATEDADVVATLVGFGMSAAQISKRARISRPTVDAAMTLAASEKAREHTAAHDLTLEQGATLAEFEDDSDAVSSLVTAAERGQFDHVAQELRDRRRFAAAKSQVVEALEQQGMTVLDRGPAYDDKTVLEGRRIRTDGKPTTDEQHVGCAGHVVWITSKWVDLDAAGNPVQYPAEPEGEDDTEHKVYEQEVARLRSTARRGEVPSVAYGCRDWRKHNHTDSYDTSGRIPVAQQSPAAREEASKARRLVIENNKAWSAAQPVRREFVKQLAKAKTTPKGAHRFIADALNLDGHLLGSLGASALAAEWVGGVTPQWGRSHVAIPRRATEARCAVLALVQIIATYEDALTPGTWREDGTDNAAGRYLRFLGACGYALSDVEGYALSAQTA